MKEFLKSGNKIYARPEGLDYKLEPSVVYTLKYDSWSGDVFLELGASIALPDNLYETNCDTKFVKKVLNNFNNDATKTCGVLLTGLKGSGKTVMSKLISIRSELPIIIVDSEFPTRKLDKFFSKFKDTKVCVIFDEIDKNERVWNTEDLLGFLDGINQTCKKLVLLTCNSDSKLNEFIKDRCSRIRYRRTFNKLDESSLTHIATSVLKDKTEIQPVVKFILDKFNVISYDNVLSFINEINDYPTDTFETIVNDLNISVKA